MKRTTLVVFVLALVLLLDQWLKIHIKLNFEYNEDIALFGQEWARLHFVENEGMAFGITFGWEYGKLLLSLFRIIMVGGLFWYIRYIIQQAAPYSLLVSVSLITAGAIGNIIDSAFYGLWFSESPYHGGKAVFANADNPAYGTFLHGKVVDMLYFPIKYFDFPEWMPFWSGESVLFFSPIFNIADAAITCGVLSIFFFQRNFFKVEEEEAVVTDHSNAVATTENGPDTLAEIEDEVLAETSATLAPEDTDHVPGDTESAKEQQPPTNA